MEDRSVFDLAVAPADTERYGEYPDHVLDIVGKRCEATYPIALIHGGYWRPTFDRTYLRPLAARLGTHVTAYNIEYRRAPGRHPSTRRRARVSGHRAHYRPTCGRGLECRRGCGPRHPRWPGRGFRRSRSGTSPATRGRLSRDARLTRQTCSGVDVARLRGDHHAGGRTLRVGRSAHTRVRIGHRSGTAVGEATRF